MSIHFIHFNFIDAMQTYNKLKVAVISQKKREKKIQKTNCKVLRAYVGGPMAAAAPTSCTSSSVVNGANDEDGIQLLSKMF